MNVTTILGVAAVKMATSAKIFWMIRKKDIVVDVVEVIKVAALEGTAFMNFRATRTI